MPCYYLGSLFYDRFRYDEAIALWEQAITRNDKHAKALRNLALAYFRQARRRQLCARLHGKGAMRNSP